MRPRQDITLTPLLVLHTIQVHLALELVQLQVCDAEALMHGLQMDMNGFVQQELTNVIWAYGTMDYRQNSAFMQRAAQEMLERGMKVFMPQAISNACWAFAKHDLVYHEFLEVSSTPHTLCSMSVQQRYIAHDGSPVLIALNCHCVSFVTACKSFSVSSGTHSKY